MSSQKKSTFNCPVCQLRYNKGARIPIYLLCCQETACKKCVLTRMVTASNAVEILSNP